MKIYGGEPVPSSNKSSCYGPGEINTINSAKNAAAALEIPHYTIDLTNEYRKTVLDYFTAEYCAGRTPNPCTRCNPRIKFGAMIRKARSLGIEFDLFATGHYARIEKNGRSGSIILKKASDLSKDQTYFLYGLSADLLPLLRFPLGLFSKKEVRKMADDDRLPASSRPESQDFASGNYTYLFDAASQVPGPILTASGRRLGSHKGIVHYTVGQRKGLGIAHTEPLYVTGIDAEQNALVVGPKSDLYAPGLIADQLNYVSIAPPSKPVRIQAKIRQQHREAGAWLNPINSKEAHVIFDLPQLAVTPGQTVVFYDGDIVLGGGIIKKAIQDAEGVLE
jgi:tRNA-specific 2-thiouridylase